MKRVLAALALLLAAAPRAQAATCQVSATDLAFGPYRFNSEVDVDSTATVSIQNCVDDGNGLTVSYTISLSAGASTDFADRTMAGPGFPLHYNVYADASYLQVWGDGTGGSTAVSDSFSLPGQTSASHTAYGRIPMHQADVEAGTYADQLVITVDY